MSDLLDRLRAATGVMPERPAPPGLAGAAGVLIIADALDPGLPILFTERTAHLRHHAGQIAFPGGRKEPGDASIIATALREASEEVGLPAGAAEVIGTLEPFATAVSNRWLTPVVAVTAAPWTVVAHRGEVADAFWIPLAELMEVPHTVRELERDGHSRQVHFYEARGRVIWGVTGAILEDLLARLG